MKPGPLSSWYDFIYTFNASDSCSKEYLKVIDCIPVHICTCGHVEWNIITFQKNGMV